MGLCIEDTRHGIQPNCVRECGESSSLRHRPFVSASLVIGLMPHMATFRFLDFLDLREAEKCFVIQFQCEVRRRTEYPCWFLRPLALALAWVYNNPHVFHDLLPYNRPSSPCLLTWSESQGPTEVSTPYHRPLRPLRLITSRRPLFPQEYPEPAIALLSDISTEQASTSFGAPSPTCQRPTTPRMRVHCHPRHFRYP